ncbi:hypothetical protein PZB74_21315 [Porifericola rhodea]|uniref:hypothetical protein n=1 Tax=Porifericola rhodea TaxID=930972 RepID=UPI0026665EC3|nr:hypothetical protein [Porifericola rhodea]WKN31492.1 hypothetical protein PZB74_21315 [Porifericola rhodea]
MPSSIRKKPFNHAFRKDHLASFQNKVNFLKKAQHYAEAPKRVFNHETHLSWIFMTDVYAYKLKKPLHLPYLNLFSIQNRKQICEQEIELSKRLAPDTYLRLVALCMNEEKQLQIEGKGKVVDWLVKMRKLDSELMLDQQIRNRQVDQSLLAKAARHLSDYYLAQPPEAISSFDYWNKLMQAIKRNYASLLDYPNLIQIDMLKEVVASLQNFLTHEEHLLENRVKQSKIIEGHGDLRPEHIYLSAKPQIIDSLEFDRELRIVDPADELAQLSVECTMLGDKESADLFIHTYRQITEDNFEDKLFLFYQCQRACLRASLSIEHLKDKQYQGDKQWQNRADKYLNLARQYAAQLK